MILLSAWQQAKSTPPYALSTDTLCSADLVPYFKNIQLIPASSGYDRSSAQKDKAHLPNIHRETGIPFADMLFFDDEHENIARVRQPSYSRLIRSARHVWCRCIMRYLL